MLVHVNVKLGASVMLTQHHVRLRPPSSVNTNASNIPRQVYVPVPFGQSSQAFHQYTQEARRLPCIVPVPSNELEHPGQHIHSTVPDVVHFCEVRCEFCDYYCTYPLGEPLVTFAEIAINHATVISI